jgi:DNA helicase-2/ATP-dependent DNA helicase PcrA
LVAGLESGRFPSERPSIGGLEEERRLAYVALTRAMERLVLIIPPDARFDAVFHGQPGGSLGLSRSPASQFVFEANLRTSMDLGAAVHARLAGGREVLPDVAPDRARILNRYLAEVGIADRYPESASRALPTGDYATGQRVRHTHFGEGVVQRSDGQTVTVRFGSAERRLRAALAPMEVVP